MSTLHQSGTNRRIMVKDLNPQITCGLCRGYLIDATTLIECLHVFCRACVLRHFENKLRCPTCSLVYKKKSYPYFRSDTIIQALVYKLVPGLYSKEIQRREDFFRSTGARAGSSCSEDSVLGDLSEDHDEWQITSPCGDQYQFLSPDDAVSLSLEYYQAHLDTTNSDSDKTAISDQKLTDLSVSDKVVHSCDSNISSVNTNDVNKVSGEHFKPEDSENTRAYIEKEDDDQHDKKNCDRRYLRCPAAVTMSLLQKFLRMKYALSTEHRVDIIHAGEVLPGYFTLMDVAYTFKWQRLKPLRFFYRIFTPIKIQPIKIITTSSGKRKQLQVVPAKGHQTPDTKSESAKDAAKMEVDDQNYRNKETLMTNLQLQSITKPPQIFTSRLNRTEEISKSRQNKDDEAHCVYEYEEPDKEEIRAFAEKRDLEWALQKQLDEVKEQYRICKKRKKSKHKANLLYKKRKLHAEITSSSDPLQNEESLKLKVKLTQPNGYRHKHHRSSQNSEHVPDAAVPQRELTSKEKLLQMRQVRHKHIVKSDNTQQPPPIEVAEKPLELTSKSSEECKPEPSPTTDKPTVSEPVSPNKTLRSDFVNKTKATKEICLQKLPTVHIERNAQTEQQAQQTFLKTFQSYTEKHTQKNGLSQSLKCGSEKTGVNTAQDAKSLEKKIANLHQQCTTIEAKSVKQESPTGLNFPKALNSQFSTGFTVSKIETGVKRSLSDIEHQKIQEKRPSLEITLINPSPAEEVKSPTKRPLPATIPLDKIRRSINRMAGVSIIPKQPEMSESATALDLSKPNKSPENSPRVTEAPPTKILNGLTPVSNRSQTPDKNIQLSNLQMLSKVASEHSIINNKRPQMPSLNTLKIPNPNLNLKANLAKLPKLNEINKTQFRLPNPQMRNMRPNQNQSIRNIPNPSLLVRQQNQNRLNSLSNPQNSASSEPKQNSVPESDKEDKQKSSVDDKNLQLTVEKSNPVTIATV